MEYIPYKVPVSVKGIVFDGEKVWLRKNERDEWELPGGKIDPGEGPIETIVRELEEELGFETKVEEIIDAGMFTVEKSMDEQGGVLVIAYLCKIVGGMGDFEELSEAGHAEFNAFRIDDLEDLNLLAFYRNAIVKALRLR